MLNFVYGCMGSGKSAMLVMNEFNFRKRKFNTIVLKPKNDKRDGDIIKPRPMEGIKVDILYSENDDLYELVKHKVNSAYFNKNQKSVVLVDEVQFSTSEHIEQLWKISDELCDVFCYGLKVSYLNKIFKPVSTLLVYSEKTVELEVGCAHCHRKATTHLLYIDDVPVTNGDDEFIGDFEGPERFESVCQKCRADILSLYKDYQNEKNVIVTVQDIE